MNLGQRLGFCVQEGQWSNRALRGSGGPVTGQRLRATYGFYMGTGMIRFAFLEDHSCVSGGNACSGASGDLFNHRFMKGLPCSDQGLGLDATVRGKRRSLFCQKLQSSGQGQRIHKHMDSEER